MGQVLAHVDVGEYIHVDMLTKKKTDGPTLSRAKIRRKQKRKPRRLVEAPPLDWARWDAEAERQGLNFSEFTRRALNNYTFLSQMQANGVGASLPVAAIDDGRA